MAKKIKMALDENTKVLIIAIAIALAAVMITFSIINGSARKAGQAYMEITVEKEKLALREDIAKIDEMIGEYHGYLYKSRDTFALRDTISNLARNSGVDIVSIQPQPSESIGDLARTSFKVRIRGTYDQVGIFIENIETLSKLTKIESLELKGSSAVGTYGSGGAYRERASMKKSTETEASLTISAYSVKS